MKTDNINNTRRKILRQNGFNQIATNDQLGQVIVERINNLLECADKCGISVHIGDGSGKKVYYNSYTETLFS